jgi:hypothetical protein
MLDLIPRIQEVWKSRQDEIRKSTQQITTALTRASHDVPGETLGKDILVLAHAQLAQRFDRQHGGFGTAPKFPTPQNLSFLLRYWRRSGDEHIVSMVENTLKAMRQGGIYDHIGFGFHRYSTDAEWLLPHFEKMLYDQALLAIAYTEAYQANGKVEYRQTAQEVFSYVLRDLRDPDGGFYSAEDADSEGEEGKFYLWNEDEIRSTLGKDEADVFIKAFNIKKGGNFLEEATGRETGRNILYFEKTIAELAPDFQMSEERLRALLDKSRQKLFRVREKRVHPHKDDKILTDWNGLIIAALAKGDQVFDKPEYAEAARHALHFILDQLRTSDGMLLHRYRDGEAAIKANLDDYAFLIWGMLELYEATFETALLQTALELHRILIKHFWDRNNGGFFFTPDDAEDLLVRKKNIYDGAVPSGNSVAMLNLLRLGRITADPDFEKKAKEIGKAFHNQVKDFPSAHTQLMVALDFAIGPSYEVVIAGNLHAEDARAMIKQLRTYFSPNKVVLFKSTEGESPDITRIAEFTNYHSAIDGKATAYVCRNYECSLPTTDISVMVTMLNQGLK